MKTIAIIGECMVELNGKPPRQCALQGHALAGTVIQHPGAIIPQDITAPTIKTFDD